MTEQKKTVTASKVEEKDLVFDKKFTCPVCDSNFTSKVVKSGKARMIGTDFDLRPRLDGIDGTKYEVQMCPNCGYAALSRFFPNIGSGQAKMIRENISGKVQLHQFEGDFYTYEEAIKRYKLALANAMVKRCKEGEKAYIYLKSAWLLRGYAEYLEENGDETKDRAALKAEEEENLLNAYNGFIEAIKTEDFPICGMDEMTMNFLLAELAFHFEKYDMASKLVADILTSTSASSRTKDKARDLKDQILAEMKKKA